MTDACVKIAVLEICSEKEDQRICSWNLLKNALQDFVNKF